MKYSALLLLLLVLISGTAHAQDMKINITADGKTLNATLEDNPASRELFARLPMTLTMEDLYSREMCYHMKDALPTGELVSDNYRVGDLIYWPPRKSLVILYRQNGERFSRQYLGHIESGVEIFESTGDTQVTFTAAE
ncbi:MAG: hypothetical protein IJU15_04060 [Synergistaceae bacterium]|nr:hypothetical protein [Synergistaceae bacterium]MBQ9404137.1 hypothetical protein [Synergistaceae bacterium]